MRFTIVAMGRLKARYAREGCAEFLKRLERYFTVNHIEVRDIRRGRGGTADDWKQAEAAALLKQIPKGAVLVVLDESGRQWSSQELARWIDEQKTRSHSSIAFILGGPDGLAKSLTQSAHRVWSLGRLTLPHELARLVMLEQLYRAGTVLAGHPYHRE